MRKSTDKKPRKNLQVSFSEVTHETTAAKTPQKQSQARTGSTRHGTRSQSMSVTTPLSDLLPTYSKENTVLAPLMNFYSNVETNVRSFAEAGESYT